MISMVLTYFTSLDTIGYQDLDLGKRRKLSH